MKKLISILMAVISLFIFTSCGATSGNAASQVLLPRQVNDSNGTSNYDYSQGTVTISGTASVEADLTPFLIASNIDQQNVILTQYGSCWPTLDVFSALATSAIISSLHPGQISIKVITDVEEKYINLLLSYSNKGLVQAKYKDEEGTITVKYSYDSKGNFTKLKSDWSGYNNLPWFEPRENKYTYKNNKISSAYGIDDGGEFTASNLKFDEKGRMISYSTKADTQGDPGIKATVYVSYNTNDYPISVKISSGNLKIYNGTFGFAYKSGNLTKLSFVREQSDLENFTFSYIY